MRVFIYLILLVSFVVLAQPNQLNWTERQYGYYAQNKPLQEVIADFAANLELAVTISHQVEGTVSGDFPIMKAVDFLSMLAQVHNLMWFYDGAVLHVYSTKEIKEEVISLAGRRVDSLENAFKQLDILGTHYHWRAIPNRNRIEISGPPRFVTLTKEVIGMSGDRLQQTDVSLPVVDDYIVKIFRLKYIYASGDAKSKTINIAKLLGQVMNVDYFVAAEDSTAQSTTQKLRGTGLSPSYGAGASTPATQKAVAPSGLRANAPYIIVDTRLNMVIVRDTVERIPLYEGLIEKLDRPLDQIEIEVLILDINEDAATASGIDWGDFIYEHVQVINDPQQFRVRLQALETEGRASVSARPSVLTLDNHEAVFSSQETFYVQLGSGQQGDAVDLVPVTYGASLTVKPHVIYNDHGDTNDILLSFNIQDGSRSATAEREVDGLPTVTNSTIKTQAIVSDGKSLLVGGYKIRQESVSDRRVPILGYIPVIGLFFTARGTIDINSRRYFLISPRVVSSEVVFQPDEVGTELMKYDEEDNKKQIYIPIKKPGHRVISRRHSGPP